MWSHQKINWFIEDTMIAILCFLKILIPHFKISKNRPTDLEHVSARVFADIDGLRYFDLSENTEAVSDPAKYLIVNQQISKTI